MLAGKRNANVLSAILQQMSIARESVADSDTEAVGSMDKQLEIYNASIQASLDRFKVAFQQLSYDIINSDLLKGFIDAGTHIIQIIDALVKNIGVLGTAITGLGIAKIFGTVASGVKTAEALTITLGKLPKTASGIEKIGATIDNLGMKAEGAGSALTGLGGSLASLLSNPVALGIGATVAAVAGIALAIKKQRDDLIKQANEATTNWGSTKGGIEEYKKKYTELNDELSKGNLSESERISIKRQLLDLQTEIVNKYGDQISGIDLVNGKLQTQLGILDSITKKEAERNIQDNYDAYESARQAMTKQRGYTIGTGSYSVGGRARLSEGTQKQYEELFNSIIGKNGNKLFSQMSEGVFKFSGDASEFDEAVHEVLSGLESITETASDADKAILQSAIDSARKALKKNTEVLDKYQENYRAYLEQNLYKDDFGGQLAEYAKRTQDYNDALLSGNMDKIVEAKSQLDEYKATVDGILGDHPEYGDFFNEITNSVDTTTEAIVNFKDIIDDGVAESTNDLKNYAGIIRGIVNSIKKMELDPVDVENIMKLGGDDSLLFNRLAKLFDKDFDFSDAAIRNFADILAQLGVVSEGTSEEVDLASASFEDFLKIASSAIDITDKATAALVNSFGSRGLSMLLDEKTGEIVGDVGAIIKAYKDLDGYDPKVLFERTADGINVNVDALRALQSEQEALTKAEFIRRIAEAQKQLNEAGTVEAQRYWQEQLDTVRLLSSAYDGATSSYQKWIDAQKMASPGSKYDQITTNALKQAKEYYDKGLTGNPVFQAIAQLFTNQDLALASDDEITKAYEDGLETVKKYFTESSDGAEAFADKLVDLELATKTWNSEIGKYDYDFSDFGINTSQLADELGISVDLVEALFGKLQEYSFDINFVTDDQLTELVSLSEKAEAARRKLEELAEAEGEVSNSDLSAVIDIDVKGIDTVKECDEAIEQINDAKAKAEVDSDEYKYLDTLLEDITLMRDTLERPTSINVDDGNLLSIKDTEEKILERLGYIDKMNAIPGVHFNIDNDEEFRGLAQQLLDLNDEEVDAYFNIQGADTVEEVIDKLKQKYTPTVSFSADASSVQTPSSQTVNINYEQGALPTLSAQTVHIDYEPNPIVVDAIAKLDSTEVDKYDPKDLDRTVTYHKNSGEVDSYNPPSYDRSVNYSINVSGTGALDALPKDGSTRDVYVNVHTNQLYTGTVSKSAFQGMSTSVGGKAHARGLLGKVGLKSNENALINELGAEIVVRPSEDSWMIFNDGKPTFASLRKDDVVFPADMTEELLRTGKADDYARLLGASYLGGTVKGKAHATRVKGGGHFGGSKSTAKKKTSSSGNSGGNRNSGGSSSTKEAKEFEEVLDEIEIKIDRIEREINNLDTIASNTFKSTNERVSALNDEISKTSKEIDIQKKAYTRYMQEAKKYASGLDANLIKEIQEGKIDIKTIKNEDTWKKIENYRKYYEAALSARDAVYKLQAQEADFWTQRYNTMQTAFENKIAQYQHMYDMMDSFISEAESRGRITANKFREKQIVEERKKLQELGREQTSLMTKMTDALKNGMSMNSEAYYEMLSGINAVREAIAETTANIAELQKSIRETNWEIFDRTADAISDMHDELEFLYDLLGDSETFFDDRGRINDTGITGMGLLAAQYNVSLQQHKKYVEEIKKMNEEVAKDPNNMDLLDRRQDLVVADRKLIQSANDAKKAMVDLVKEGIQAQVNSLKTLIDSYNELIDKQKDETDYAKRVASAQSDINKLQKQLNAYGNDDSEEGATRRQRLRNELKNARENLEQTQEERRISQTKKILSELQEDYEEVLNARLDDINALIQSLIAGVDANADIVKNTVETATKDIGYILTDPTSKIFSGSHELVSYFMDGDFVNKVTNIATAVNSILSYYRNAVVQTNTEQAQEVKEETKTDTKIKNTAERAKNTANKTTGTDGSWVTDDKKQRIGWKFNDGTLAKGGWSQIDKQWYYFNDEGKIRAGLQTIGKNKYYLRRYGGRATKEWVQVGSDWYYFDQQGRALSGWHSLDKDGKKGWYFFDPKTNAMATNTWIQNSTRKGTQYVGEDGRMFVNGKFKTKDGYRTFDEYGRWKGYKSGTRSVGADGMYWTNEGAPETIIRKHDGAVLTKLNAGDAVLNNKATSNMWDFANNPSKFLRGLGYNGGNDVDLVINLNGLKNPSEFMDALRKDKKFERFLQEVTIGRVNGKGVLAKNAIAF